MRSRLTGMTMPVLRPEVGTMKVNKSMRLTAAVTAVALLSGCGIFKGKSGPKTPVVGERIPILTAESSVKVDPSIADVQVVLPAPEPNGEWSQPGGNAAKSMGHLALGGSLQKVWSANIHGSSNSARLASAPVVSRSEENTSELQSLMRISY